MGAYQFLQWNKEPLQSIKKITGLKNGDNMCAMIDGDNAMLPSGHPSIALISVNQANSIIRNPVHVPP